MYSTILRMCWRTTGGPDYHRQISNRGFPCGTFRLVKLLLRFLSDHFSDSVNIRKVYKCLLNLSCSMYGETRTIHLCLTVCSPQDDRWKLEHRISCYIFEWIITAKGCFP